MSLHNPQLYIDRLKDKFPDQYIDRILRNTHPVHIAFDLINLDACYNDVPWTKCLDCGQPYVLVESSAASKSTFCSEKCEEATRTYLGL